MVSAVATTIPLAPSPAQPIASPADFRRFLLDNNIIITAAAVTIGFASASFIKAFVVDIFMPAVYYIIGYLILKNVSGDLFKGITHLFGNNTDFNLDAFLQEFITWTFVLIAAYLIMDITIRRFLLNGGSAVNSHAALSPAAKDNQVYITAIAEGQAAYGH